MRPVSFAGRNSGWLDISQLPGDQDAGEQQDRQAHPYCQRPGHVIGLRCTIAAILHHEIEGDAEAADDGQKREDD